MILCFKIMLVKCSCENPRAFSWDDTGFFYFNQDHGFESSIEHAAALKLLGRVFRPFWSHKAQWISLCTCARERYLVYTNNKKSSCESFSTWIHKTM